MGHDPVGALGSTVHDQETKPPPSASLGARPSAVLGPDAYVIVIEQKACGFVVTVARAGWPRATGVVTTRAMSSEPMTLSILIADGSGVVNAATAVAVAAPIVGLASGVTAGCDTAVAHAVASNVTARVTAETRKESMRRFSRSPIREM